MTITLDAVTAEMLKAIMKKDGIYGTLTERYELFDLQILYCKRVLTLFRTDINSPDLNENGEGVIQNKRKKNGIERVGKR